MFSYNIFKLDIIRFPLRCFNRESSLEIALFSSSTLDSCKDNGKRINDWLSNKETQEYLNAVSHEYKCQIEYDCTDAGIPAPGLLYRIDVSGKDLANGYAELQGYYIHPDLFHDVCYWANKPYAVKVSRLMNLINERNRLLNQTLEQTIAQNEIYGNIKKRLVLHGCKVGKQLKAKMNKLGITIEIV